MKHLIVAASVAACGTVLGAQSPLLSPAEVAAAIEQGQAGQTLQKKCGASGENGFEIVVEGPVGRIMRAAREAQAEQRAFGAEDVTLALDGPFVTVTTRRDRSRTTESSAVQKPGVPGVWVLPEAAEADRRQERLTLGSRYRTDVVLRIKPSGAKTPITLKPLALVNNGATASRPLRPNPGSDITATFDLMEFRTLPAGTVEVVVFMTDAGERTCKLSDKDRQAIK